MVRAAAATATPRRGRDKLMNAATTIRKKRACRPPDDGGSATQEGGVVLQRLHPSRRREGASQTTRTHGRLTTRLGMADQRRRIGCAPSVMRSARQRLPGGVVRNRFPDLRRRQALPHPLFLSPWIGLGRNIVISQGEEEPESDRRDRSRSQGWDYRRTLGDGDGDTRACMRLFSSFLFLLLFLVICVAMLRYQFVRLCSLVSR